MKGRLFLLGALAAASLTTSAAQAQSRPRRTRSVATPPAPVDPVEVEYRRLIDLAVQEFAVGHFEEALALFREAYGVRPTAKVLRGIARAHFELRQYVKSVEACDQALASTVDPLDETMRADVVELRARAAGFVGTVTIVVEPEAAEVLLDGRPLDAAQREAPVVLEQGAHTVDVSAQGYQPVHREFDVVGRTDAEVRIRLFLIPPPGSDRHPIRNAGVGVGAAGVVGLVLSSIWLADRNGAVEQCTELAAQGGMCSNADAVATQHDAAAWGLSLSVVATAAGGALVLYDVLRPNPYEEQARATVRGACGPTVGGATCFGRVSW